MALTKKQELELTRLLALEAKVQASKSYKAYVRYTNPGYQLMPYNELIISTIQEALDKQDAMNRGEIPKANQYIMMSMPPRHGKSHTVTETLPSYVMGKHKKYKGILTAYSSTLADDFARANSRKTQEFNVFGATVKVDNQDRTEYSNGSTFVKAGILGGITGKGANLLLIDDPIKTSEEAQSETHRNKVWGEWQASLSTRLEPPAIVILIMTRWHEDDLAGRLLNEEYGKPLPWTVINLPMEAEDNDILGRAVGEPLWPDKYGLDFIEERKQYPSIFNSLYQGRPTAAEGNIIKRHYWQYYDARPEFLARIPMTIMSVDAAFKDTKDPVGIQIWGKHMSNYYLIDRINERLDFTATLQAIRTMLKKYPECHLKLIEDKANGSAIINVLNKEIGGFIPVQPYGNKVSRVQAVLPYIEAGNVYLPRYYNAEEGKCIQPPWVNEFIEQCASFPTGAHDEDPDALSQALSRLVAMGTMGNAKGPGARDDFGIYQKENPDEIDDSYIEMKVR